MPKPTDPKIKAQALKLYAQGLSKVEIAKTCRTSYRTIQRWLADVKPVRLAVEVTDTPKPETRTQSDIEAESCHTPSPLSQIEKIATTPSGETTIVEFSRKIAAELLRLTGASFSLIAEVLEDPDAKRSDRLKAAQILLNSVGVGQAADSVFNAIKRRFAIPKLQGTSKLRDLQNFWGKELIPDREPTPEELEWRRRLQEQRTKDNDELKKREDDEQGWETGDN